MTEKNNWVLVTATLVVMFLLFVAMPHVPRYEQYQGMRAVLALRSPDGACWTTEPSNDEVVPLRRIDCPKETNR